MKKKCAQCGKKTKKNFKYCGECGTLMPEEEIAPDKVKCTGCGSMISPEIKFCNKCGMQLTGNEEHVKDGKKKKSIIRRIVNYVLFALLIAIVVMIGVYIGAGFLFKHDSINLDDQEKIMKNIQEYIHITYEDDEIFCEIEEDAINAFIADIDMKKMISNQKIRIDDAYIKSKTLTFYINAKAYGLYFPLSFKVDIDDDDDEIAIKITDLKHSRLNLPLPNWPANYILKDKLVFSRDDGVLPQNIYYKSMDGSKRNIEMVLEVDSEHIIKNIQKELDSASQDILDKMAEKPLFITAYEILTGEDFSKEQVSMQIMELMSKGEVHKLFLPFAQSVIKEEMGTILYDTFGMEGGIKYLMNILNAAEE